MPTAEQWNNLLSKLDDVRSHCDAHVSVLKADLSRCTDEGERTRLIQSIKAIENIRSVMDPLRTWKIRFENRADFLDALNTCFVDDVGYADCVLTFFSYQAYARAIHQLVEADLDSFTSERPSA